MSPQSHSIALLQTLYCRKHQFSGIDIDSHVNLNSSRKQGIVAP